MARYRMDDNTVIDTDKAKTSWDEDTFFDGRNRISKATGTQFEHQKLYCSRKGRYYLEHWSQWQGSHAYVEWVSPQTAASWLLANNEALPEDLSQYEDQFVE